MGDKADKRRRARLQRLADAGRDLIPSREAELAQRTAQKVASASTWPIVGAWLRRTWTDDQLFVGIIARRRPDGELAAASLLVDLGCLGLKDGDVRPHLTSQEWTIWFDRANGSGDLTPCPPEQVAAAYQAGVRWARKWGFRPAAIAPAVENLLSGISPDGADEIPVGADGKPLYVAGPHDDVSAILARLEETAGRGNYHYVAPLE